MTFETLVSWIGAVVQAQPGRPAFVDDGRTITYREFWERSASIARCLLATGIEPGQAVALVGPNSHLYVETYFGIMRAGCHAVPIDPRLDVREVLAHIDLVDARAVFAGDDELRDQLAPNCRVLPMDGTDGGDVGRLAKVGPMSPCVIMPTSGSTGRPKAVVHSQRTMTHAVLQVASRFPFGPTERAVVFLPLHACMPELVLPILCTGGSLEILPRFDVERVASACTRATMFDAVPTILSRLIEHAPHGQLSQLRWLMFASEMMPPALLQAWWDAFPDLELHQLYGMTEMLPITAASHEMLLRSPTTVGTPFSSTGLRIASADDPTGSGEVLVAGPARMERYFDDPAMTDSVLTRDGFMRTGDLARIDDQGLVHLTGRSKDIIISGGINIVPSEIELVAAQHPGVERAVVVGMPSQRWGETPVVVAVPRAGSGLTPQALLAHCRTHLVGHKRPSGAALVDEFPVTGIGKAAKARLAAMITEGGIALVHS